MGKSLCKPVLDFCCDRSSETFFTNYNMRGKLDSGLIVPFLDVDSCSYSFCMFLPQMNAENSPIDRFFQVTRAEAEELARTLNVPYVECSAKLQLNVDQAFHADVRLVR